MKINEIEAGEKQSFRQDTSSGYNAPPEPHEVEKILNVVAENCSEAIASMKQVKKLLFRGLKNKGDFAYPIAFHGRSREHRMPMSTASNINDTLNQGLANSGMKALRNNSIFVTSSTSFASIYGNLYCIFPIDGFQFTWNTKYDDFFTDYIYSAIQHPKMDSESLARAEKARYDFTEVAKTPHFAKIYKFENTDFAKAINSGNEILISGEYYALYAADFKQYLPKLFQ